MQVAEGKGLASNSLAMDARFLVARCEDAKQAERLFANLCCEPRAKLVPPAAHLIMADFDPAFAHQISDVARRQRGPAVKQDRQTDDLWVLLEVAKKPMFGHG